MRREEHASPIAMAPMLSAGTRGPRWRALLEARWQARLEEVTELSLTYHGTAAADPDGHGDGAGDGQPGPVFPQSTGFVLDPAGKVVVSVYSAGAIGRLVPEDVVGLVRYLRQHATA